MIEGDAQRRGVETRERLEEPAAARLVAGPARAEACAEHRHEGERDEGGNDDCGGEGDRELVEEPPTTSPMNRSGIKTAISDTVSEMMVKPICAEPLIAASWGLSPGSR